MSKKYPCLLAAALLIGIGPVQAEPRPVGGTAERLWVLNLGDGPAEVALDASGGAGVRVEAGETVEAPELLQASGPAVVSQGAEVLWIKASRGFDPSALEIDLRGKIRREQAGKRMRVRVDRPAWAQELMSLAASGGLIRPGRPVEFLATEDADGHARLAVGLAKDSAVTVSVKGEGGAVTRSFSVTSSVPVRWRADLGSAADLKDARITLRVDRGGVVVGSKGRPRSITAALSNGTISFSQDINYSGTLYFYVDGGPPSTCGELNTYRNGSWLFAGNYVCTDANGDSTMGPWYWSSSNSQTDDPLFVRWPDNSTTNSIWHIWDKTSAVTYRDSSWGAPPTTYYGHATDTQWEAGFDFGGFCFSDFQDTTTGLWWNPSTDTYSSSGYRDVNATLTRVSRWYVYWDTAFPSPGSHVTGHSYQWYTCCLDGNSGQCTSGTFTK